tara:strand:- start:182 stop:475 length:294 start_codon:yes stop_codon:yes gene_type:complete
MEKDYFQEALHTFNGGDWYGWKKEDEDGNKIPNSERMQYKHIQIIKDGAKMPSEAEVNAKIQQLKNADTAKADNKTSAITKLKKLGLTDDEITALGL